MDRKLSFVKLEVPAEIPKRNIGLAEMAEPLIEEMTEKAYGNVCDRIREEEPDAPREWIEEFVRTFIRIRLASEYDVRKKEYIVVAVPEWREVDEIDWDENILTELQLERSL